MRQLSVIGSRADSGDADGAMSELNAIISNASDPLYRIECYRLRSKIHRSQHNLAAARESLDAASSCIQRNGQLGGLESHLDATLAMDRADLEAFSAGNSDAAITLYDSVVSNRQSASRNDVRYAMQNAAILCSDGPRKPEAVRRVDAILRDASVMSEMPESHVIGLRFSQASWIQSMGDLHSATEKYLALWQDYPNSTNAQVIHSAVIVASLRPVGVACADRLTLASLAHARMEAARQSNGELPMEYRDIEYQIAIVVVDSQECAGLDPTLLLWAQRIRNAR
ncbi:MAG: hypothetical protein IPK69_05690 [Phycisphaerales bacterium]|nr:MAG: hypothetical protein IPK69_05690 [Phycisphaerales bacterium]